MPFIHGKSAAVFHGANNLSSFLNNASFSGSVETGEVTGFGVGSKSYIVGLKDATLSLAGMFDGVAGAIDPVLAAALAVEDVPVTIMPQGADTVGNRAQMAQTHETSYEVTTPVADVVSISAEFQIDGGADYGVVLAPHTARTATGTNTAVDNSAASTNGGVAIIHVTANTRASSGTVVKVQHSTDNVTFTDLVTFTTIGTTTTSERVLVAAGTTVNRYIRHNMTAIGGASGSITYTVSFARR